jgi:hypothetical protein
VTNQYIALHQRNVADTSIRAGEMPAPREPSIRHMLASRYDKSALCTYRVSPGDALDGSYFDLRARDCPACLIAAAKA